MPLSRHSPPSLSCMVAVSPPAKVLVTGANGYIATWITKKYLEAGYSVRCTVRSLSKSAFLNDNFAHYGDRFELVVVEGITKDGAFDEAVKGVDAIAHTASPFHVESANPDGMSDFLRVRTLFGAQDNKYRPHHSCRAGNHINPQLCLTMWECFETCDPHLFGCGESQRHHGATRIHRKRPQSFRREGGEDKRLCNRARHNSLGLEDAGRESCVEVCRSLWVSDVVGSRCPQLTMHLWGMPLFAVLSLKSEVFIFTAFA